MAYRFLKDQSDPTDPTDLYRKPPMAKSKAAPTASNSLSPKGVEDSNSLSPRGVETVDDANKAVIDDSTSRSPSGVSPQPLDLRVAAMLGMGLDVVRERLEQLDESGYQSVEQFVTAKDHPSLAAMLSPRP
jgi:hypothetical protein